MVESAGVSEYNALTLQLTKRLSRGLQFSVNYTLSKAEDDAPEQNLTTGNIQGLVLSDPFNRRLDKGHSFADQRHTFVMSLVARPKFNFQNKTLHYLLNNNQVGIIATANSGETFNIVSTSDINGDGRRFRIDQSASNAIQEQLHRNLMWICATRASSILPSVIDSKFSANSKTFSISTASSNSTTSR